MNAQPVPADLHYEIWCRGRISSFDPNIRYGDVHLQTWDDLKKSQRYAAEIAKCHNSTDNPQDVWIMENNHGVRTVTDFFRAGVWIPWYKTNIIRQMVDFGLAIFGSYVLALLFCYLIDPVVGDFFLKTGWFVALMLYGLGLLAAWSGRTADE